jgi:hypothetical protein
MNAIHVKKMLAAAILALFAGLSTACSWVETTPQGDSVRVSYADAVATCTRVGNVNVSLKNKVAGVERKADKVATELATLARNEGAIMGGDNVVAESPVSDGRQEFGVYRCNN